MTDTYKHFELNAKINLVGEEGGLQLHKDKEALHHYFREDVNRNTVFFHTLKEKLEYLVDNHYYEQGVLSQYSDEFIKSLFKRAYSKNFRFQSFVGAYKYYRSYTLKTFDGERYLERYEDRVCMTALYLAQGDEKLAEDVLDEIISNRFQPATPTFLNAGKKQRGEMVSCFLLRIEDNMESISRSITSALQLSKRGGGVAFLLSNLREKGAPIKNVEGQCSGVVPVMKMFEDAFSYANQLGSRAGAGAVYLNAHHPDIMDFLDTKRENADEKIRIKSLSTGVVIPDITYHLAKENKEMYLFSPHDVENVYGKPFADTSVTENYQDMVDNQSIRKSKINAREFFVRIAQLQFESGYPFIMNEDTVNRENPVEGRINMSNLCVSGDTKILTRDGYVDIRSMAGKQADIWNGKEWSSVPVVQTGKNQELLRVEFDHTQPLDCTPYHRFLVQHKDGKKTRSVVRAHELKEGYQLARWDLPIIEGGETLEEAYTKGSCSFDGVVPGASYTIKSRLEWLGGYADEYGAVLRKGLQIVSSDEDFLYDVQLMLQTLGVESTVMLSREDAKTYHRLVMSSVNLSKLVSLGLTSSRINLPEFTGDEKEVKCFTTVKSVDTLDGLHDTFCFKENKRNMGMFGGVCTLNCSEILQVNTPSFFNEDGSYEHIGKDISCNLGSMNVALAMESDNFGKTVSTAIRGLTSVSDLSNINSAPSVHEGNRQSHAIGLGQMNLAGYFAKNHMEYGGDESLDFTNIYFYTVAYHAYVASMEIAKEKGKTFEGFDKSDYATGKYFDKYTSFVYQPKTEKVKRLFSDAGIDIPTQEDWKRLVEQIRVHGLYHSNLQAVPPTGSISYINNSTASIHPVASAIEKRKEGKLGTVYYPAPFLSEDNIAYYKDAYQVGPEKVIDVYAEATKHIDQGLSLTLFFPSTATTRDVNKAQIYAWRKGIKTLYYIRIKQKALEGTEVEECVSCTL